MPWYESVIFVLGAAALGSLSLNIYMVSVLDDLRMQNAKLRIDLMHK